MECRVLMNYDLKTVVILQPGVPEKAGTPE